MNDKTSDTRKCAGAWNNDNKKQWKTREFKLKNDNDDDDDNDYPNKKK